MLQRTFHFTEVFYNLNLLFCFKNYIFIFTVYKFFTLEMALISAVIITYNEEDNIERCIKSVLAVADEVVVLDSYSTDKTEDICRDLGVKFFQQSFIGYKEQKNSALRFATHDYVLSLDADEALSEDLKRSILQIKDNLKFDGYILNRLNNYCGQWIYYSNWYPDKKLRLFNKNKGVWGGINPHDRFLLNKGCTSTRLKGDILHWVLDSYEEHIAKANNFSTIAAKEYFELGRKSSIAKIIFNTGWRFFKAYIIRLGFLDGFNGFVISSFSAYTSFLKYVKLRQLILESRGNNGNGLLKKEKKIKIAS